MQCKSRGLLLVIDLQGMRTQAAHRDGNSVVGWGLCIQQEKRCFARNNTMHVIADDAQS
jgi:hypothetical protein